MCDKNKSVETTFQVIAPIDKPTCLEQASLAYRMWEQERSLGNFKTADLWMGIAHILYHLEDGSYVITQTISKPNLGVY